MRKVKAVFFDLIAKKNHVPLNGWLLSDELIVQRLTDAYIQQTGNSMVDSSDLPSMLALVDRYVDDFEWRDLDDEAGFRRSVG